MSPHTHTQLHTHNVSELQWSCEGYKLESTRLRRTAGWKDKVTFWFRSLKTIWAKQIILRLRSCVQQSAEREHVKNTQVSAEKWTNNMSDFQTLGSSQKAVWTLHTHTGLCFLWATQTQPISTSWVFFTSCFFALSLPRHKYSWHLKADRSEMSAVIDWNNMLAKRTNLDSPNYSKCHFFNLSFV